MRLSKRLAAVARLASGGVNIADVGTDHGYIPVYFALTGHSGRLAASDVNPGPIESARRSAREAGVADRIEFTLADGLRGLDGDFDTVIIAGMGGELIARILSQSPFPLEGRRFVLQPQSKPEELVRFLRNNDLAIESGDIVRDMGRLYLCFSAVGGKRWSYAPTPGEELIPRELRGCGLYPEYREMTAHRLRKAAEGLESAERPDFSEIERLKKLIEEL